MVHSYNEILYSIKEITLLTPSNVEEAHDFILSESGRHRRALWTLLRAFLTGKAAPL